jgi:hypothetical protein
MEQHVRTWQKKQLKHSIKLQVFTFGGLVVSMLASGAVGFFLVKNPQNAFLQKGSKAICHMSQICSMLKNPVITWKSGHRQNQSAISRRIVPHFATRSTHVYGAVKVRTSKGRGKQWQPTPKNLPRTQCTRVIPVAWLGSGSCQTSPKAEYY